MNVEININDYLSEEDKIEIAKEEFRNAIRSAVVVDKERILSNCAYGVVQKLVDEHFNEDINTILTAKVVDIIKDMSAYNVFKAKDAWGKDESKGWTYLQAAIDNNKSLIDTRVKEIVEDFLTTEGREVMIEEIAQDAVYRVITDRLIGKNK